MTFNVSGRFGKFNHGRLDSEGFMQWSQCE
jgi:hypothetical protein